MFVEQAVLMRAENDIWWCSGLRKLILIIQMVSFMQVGWILRKLQKARDNLEKEKATST